MSSSSDLTVPQLAALTQRLIVRSLEKGGISNYTLSFKRIRQLAEALIKDLRRVEDNQGSGIALTKVVGYWAFWIRKTHPVIVAYEGKSDSPQAEIPDINERVALEFAVSFIASQNRTGSTIHDPFRSECKQACDGSACVAKYAKYMLDVHDHVFEKYLIYSMRFRTFGPHHFVMMLDQMLISACFHRHQGYPA